jgi:hypothetical protein
MPSLLTALLTTLPLTAHLTLITAAATNCTRPFLESLTSAYIAAQKAGNPSLLTALAPPSPNLIYLENGARRATGWRAGCRRAGRWWRGSA